MLTSTNYKLYKPELTDVADVTLLSQNMETIDGLIFNAFKKINDIDVGVTTFNGKKGAVTGVSSFNGKTGEIKGVNSVNGKTGDVTVVESIQGKTGDVNLLDLVYPIGSVYITLSTKSPEVLFGGKWKQIKGRFLLSADTTYKAGATGGEASHTLTVDEMPAHGHTGRTSTNGSHRHGTWGENYTNPPMGIYDNSYHMGSNGGRDYDNRLYNTTTDGDHAHTLSIDNTGGNKAHNNMPPYLVTYMWQRVA